MLSLSFASPLDGKKREKRYMKLLPALRCGINGEFMPRLVLCSQFSTEAAVHKKYQLLWRDHGPC